MNKYDNKSIDQYELADILKELVIGHAIVKAEGDTLTLDNGTTIRVEDSSDCCAWGTAYFGDLADSQNVITRVEGASTNSGDDDEYGLGSARVFLLTDAGTAMVIDQQWEPSNGYYFYGLYLTVTEVLA